MGMFNTVKVSCPNCSAVNEHQSKAGSCMLRTRPLARAEMADVAEIAKETHRCHDCGGYYRIQVQWMAHAVQARPSEDDADD